MTTNSKVSFKNVINNITLFIYIIDIPTFIHYSLTKNFKLSKTFKNYVFIFKKKLH